MRLPRSGIKMSRFYFSDGLFKTFTSHRGSKTLGRFAKCPTGDARHFISPALRCRDSLRFRADVYRPIFTQTASSWPRQRSPFTA